MAPIKFEENIKDKLENRSLTPSSDSWSKLSERLDADKKKTNNPIFWWLSIAASLAIMIAVTVQFFNKQEAKDIIPEIVEEQVKEDQSEIDMPIKNNKEVIDLVLDNNDEQKEDELEKSVPQRIDYKDVLKSASKGKSRLAENKQSIKKEVESNRVSKEVSIIIDESHLKEVVTEVINGQRLENTKVIDKEVDSLLKLANKELFKEGLQRKSTKTVDANSLLMSVEDEMGQSFRTKVFEALKGGYETVKTAVAERNN